MNAPSHEDLRELLRLATEAEQRFEATGDVAALDDAVRWWQAALTHPDFDAQLQPQKPAALNNAGMVFLQHYQVHGKMSSLERAIDLLQQSADLMPARPADRAAVLSNLSAAVQARFVHYGDDSDLSFAVEAAQLAVSQLPGDDPERVRFLSTYLGALYERYSHSGDLADLDRAIALSREALALTPEDSPDHALRTSNSAALLQERYNRLGRLEDLRQAVDMHRTAVEQTPPESPHLSSYLNNWSGSLLDLYRRSGDLDDLQKSIEAARLAVNFVPENSPNRAGFFNNLGNALYAYYQRANDLETLHTAIDAQRLAAGMAPHQSAQRASFLTGLGSLLSESFLRTRDLAEIDEAIAACQQALDLTPAGSPRLASRWNNLGRAWRERYNQSGSAEDLQHGQVAYQQACERALAQQTETALVAGYNWGLWALQRQAWDEAGRALRYGLQAADQLFRAELLRANQEAWLREAQVLPVLAAYAMARLGRFEEAVATLEHGRARLLAEVMERDRIDLEQLVAQGHAEEYRRYRRAADRIAAFERAPVGYGPNQVSDSSAVVQAARAELDHAIQAIQCLAGYEDFFQAPDMADIQAALTQGTPSHVGVYLATTPIGSLALIVGTEGVRSVWLDFTDADLDRILKGTPDDLLAGFLAGQLNFAAMRVILDGVMPDLSAQLLRPLGSALRQLSPRPERITLIPHGHLSLLPLHTVPCGYAEQQSALLDEFIVTFAPSARVLAQGQKRTSSAPRRPPRLLAIGDPQPLPVEVSPLPYSRFEVEAIVPLFYGQARMLCETDAALPTVITYLDAVSYLHFSCHAAFDPETPLKSGLLLGDGQVLSVANLLEREQQTPARLVTLSACQTALTDFTHLPEEVIGLPAAFLQVGALGVIGTLWAVNDASTMLMMVKFYEAHLKEGLAPAAALRKAQLWLRDVTNAELSELFAQYRLTATDRPASTRLAYEMASEKFREHTLRDPNEKPYVHPYYWASFVFYGV